MSNSLLLRKWGWSLAMVMVAQSLPNYLPPAPPLPSSTKGSWTVADLSKNHLKIWRFALVQSWAKTFFDEYIFSASTTTHHKIKYLIKKKHLKHFDTKLWLLRIFCFLFDPLEFWSSIKIKYLCLFIISLYSMKYVVLFIIINSNYVIIYKLWIESLIRQSFVFLLSNECSWIKNKYDHCKKY